MSTHPDMIDRYQSDFMSWSDEDIHRKNKELRLKLNLKLIGGVVGAAALTGAAVGLATEASHQYYQGNAENPIVKVVEGAKNIAQDIENPGDLAEPSGTFEVIGSQTVVAHENDTIEGLIKDNVKGWAKLNSEQFRSLEDTVIENNGGPNIINLQGVILPESVSP